MDIKKIIANEINLFHWGAFVISKVQFIVTLLILIKVYETTSLQKVIITVIAVYCIRMIGYFFDKYFREDFQKQAYKNTLYK